MLNMSFFIPSIIFLLTIFTSQKFHITNILSLANITISKLIQHFSICTMPKELLLKCDLNCKKKSRSIGSTQTHVCNFLIPYLIPISLNYLSKGEKYIFINEQGGEAYTLNIIGIAKNSHFLQCNWISPLFPYP